MKMFHRVGLAAAAIASTTSAAFAQAAPADLNAGVTAAFGDINETIGTAGPLLLAVAGAVALIGIGVKMVRKAG
jgi:hypothetical protein